MIEGISSWLRTLGTELSASLRDPGVWLGLAVALILGGLCLLAGIFALRRTGLLNKSDAPSDVFGLGLGTGLIAAMCIVASIGSFGASALVPVAVALVAAVALGNGRKRKAAADASIDPPGGGPVDAPGESDAQFGGDNPGAEQPAGPEKSRVAGPVRIAVVAGMFILAVGFLNGTTIAPSPRAGLQPTPNLDYVYWPTLSVGLAQNGTESQWFASGFDHIGSGSEQSWYHWGELWLAALPAKTLGTSPPVARYYVVIPLLLLAICALAGSLARRLADGGRRAYSFGAVGVLLLAPIPITHMETFGATRPLLYQINNYGAASLAVVLSATLLVRLADHPRRRGGVLLVGALTASVAPLNPIFAIVGVFGCGIGAGSWVLTRRRRSGGFPSIAPEYRRTALLVVALVTATVGWGLATGHGVKDFSVGQAGTPFNYFWMAHMAQTMLGAGLLLALPIVWFVRRLTAGAGPPILLGAVSTLIVGALIWGFNTGNYNYQHFFLGSVAVFVFPVAGFAVWSLCDILRARGRPKIAAAVGVLFVLQVVIGIFGSIWALHSVRQDGYEFPASAIQAIEQHLPAEAKLAYGCAGVRPPELNFYLPRLAGVDAITGRRMIPFCHITSDPYFSLAPQAKLFGTLGAKPSPDDVLHFFNDEGIEYLYADRNHPNTLVPMEHLELISDTGGAQIFRIVP